MKPLQLLSMLAFVLLWACGLSSASAQAEKASAGEVTVRVEGFTGKDGIALVALFGSEETWLEIPKAVQVVRAKITGKTLSVKFRGVRPGTYAVEVIHDENKNNKLDMRWLPYPKPKEGAGASQGAKGKMGPPKWKDAKFTVGDKPVTVTVKLQYL